MKSLIRIEQRTDSFMTYDSWIVFEQKSYGKIVYAEASTKIEAFELMKNKKEK